MKRLFVIIATVAMTLALFPAASNALINDGKPGNFVPTDVTISWTASPKGNFGYVAIICNTDEATPRFWASQMPLPATGSLTLGTNNNSVVFNPGAAAYTYTGTITCEGRVISNSSKRLVGYTTPRFFPGLYVTPIQFV